MAREQLVDDVELAASDLGLRQRPHLDAVDAPRERVDHLAMGQHVRGPGDQEATRDRVGVHRALELEQQRRRVLDLVDDSRPTETCHEPCGVVVGRLSSSAIVQGHEAHRMLTAWPREFGDESRLADLPGAGHEDDPRVIKALGDERLDATRKELGHDQRWAKARRSLREGAEYELRKRGVQAARLRSATLTASRGRRVPPHDGRGQPGRP